MGIFLAGELNHAVLGGGPMGVLLASLLCEKAETVDLWIPDSVAAQNLERYRRTEILQKPIEIPDNLTVQSDLDKYARNSWIFHIAVPSRTLEEIIDNLFHSLDPEENYGFVLYTKGILSSKIRKTYSVINFSSYIETLLHNKGFKENHIAVINGPSLLGEMIEEKHSYFQISTKEQEFGDYLCNLYQNSYLHSEWQTDMQAAEIVAILKNPIAIAMGIVSVLPNTGYNLMGELISRSYKEMRIFSEHFGVSRDVLEGRSGLADLITTAMSPKSRNRDFGRKIVGELLQGSNQLSIRDRLELFFSPRSFIEKEVIQWHDTIEGAFSLGLVLDIAKEKKLELPLYQTLYDVLSRKRAPETLINLLSGKHTIEEIPLVVATKKVGMDLAAGVNFQNLLEERIIKHISNTSGQIGRMKKQSANLLSGMEKRLIKAKLKENKTEIQNTVTEISLWKKFQSSGHDTERNILHDLIHFYIKEMADTIRPTIRNSMLNLVAPIRWISSGFNLDAMKPIVGGEIGNLISLASKYNILYAPMHRSHLDSVEVALGIHSLGLSLPRYAAGINLMTSPFWEWMLKSLGAYAVDRERTRNGIYLECLTNYSTMMLEYGIPTLVYPEGTRSRTGGIVPLKTGLLNTAVEAYRNTGSEILVVPLALSYESVPEDEEFIGRPVQLTMSDFLSKRSKVYLDVGKPIPVSEHINQDDPTLSIGNHILQNWKKAIKLLPNQIVAKIILDNELSVATEEMKSLIEEFVINHPGNYLTMDPHEISKQGLDILKKRNIIKIEGQTVYGKDSGLVEYYASMIPDMPKMF